MLCLPELNYVPSQEGEKEEEGVWERFRASSSINRLIPKGIDSVLRFGILISKGSGSMEFTKGFFFFSKQNDFPFEC